MPKLSPITQDLILRSKAYQQGMADANKKLRRFDKRGQKASRVASTLGKNIRMVGAAALAAAGVGGLGSFITASISTANAIGRASHRLGLSVSEFQDFTNAAKAADIQTNVTEMGLQRFTRRLGEAQQGGGELLGTLQKYNIALRNSDGTARSATDVMGDLAEVIKNAESPAERLRIAFKAFDSEGADLVRILDQGREGLKEFVQTGNQEFGKFESGTVASLSRADAAIRKFKSKATIRVGELIAGEGNGAAAKILTAQLMGTVAKFSVGLLEVVIKLGKTIPTFIGGALEGVANKFGFSLEAVVLRFRIGFMRAANAVIMKLNETTGTNFGLFNLGGRDGPLRKLGEAQKRAAKGGMGVMKTATDKVLKLWNDEPLKGWKSDIDAGTKAITEAYQADLNAAREAAQVRAGGAAASQPTGGAAAAINKAKLKTASNSKGPIGGFSGGGAGGMSPGFSSMGQFAGTVTRVTSEELRKALDKITDKASSLRRKGDFKQSDELLDQRFGLRRQIDATRSQERIDRLTSGETSFNASTLKSGASGDVGQNTARIAELQARNVELLELIANEFA